MTVVKDIGLDRPILSEVLTTAMLGRSQEGALPFSVKSGTVKTFALEVNAPVAASLGETAAVIASGQQLTAADTHDASLAVLWSDQGGIFIDAADPRFWLIHSTAPMSWLRPMLGNIVWRSPWMDWCWLTVGMLGDLRDRGSERWFKADFKGAELLPAEGVSGRRLKVQLEGDDPERLQEVLRGAGYKSSTALTGIALTLADDRLGRVEEAAHYRGSFSTRGDSFDLHLAFVAGALARYAKAVREVEAKQAIGWNVHERAGMTLDGGVIEIGFERKIANMEHFLSGLFSCRDPFRLWAVPRPITQDFIEAEVVDLHIGQRFRMDVMRDGLRIYLGRDNCGNTLFRLLANLQHRFDAAATATVTSRDGALAWAGAS